MSCSESSCSSPTGCASCSSPKASQPSQPEFGVDRGGFRNGGGFRGGFGRIGGFPFNRSRGFFQQPYFYPQALATYAAGCAQLDANLPASSRAVVNAIIASGNLTLRAQLSTAMRDLGYPLAAACLSRGY